jgi:hypothetical protein
MVPGMDIPGPALSIGGGDAACQQRLAGVTIVPVNGMVQTNQPIPGTALFHRAMLEQTRYWSAVDNWPENEPERPRRNRRLGKRRKLPDIKLKYAGQRETPYFRFEARKLAGTGDLTGLISHTDGLAFRDL